MRLPVCVAILLWGITSLSPLGCERGKPSAEGAGGARYGELMSEVGRRFELLGRAAGARRWELAGFELHELEETFEDLPHAKPPEGADKVDLRALEQAFTNTHPPALQAALTAKDQGAFAKAFGETAGTCNGCHHASGHAFIEIPSEPGATIPKLDPVP
jgi:cytochrome c553